MRVSLFKQSKNENLFEVEKFFETQFKHLMNDFHLITQLLHNCKKKVDRDVNTFLIHFKILTYDQLVEPNEIMPLCNNALRSLFEVATCLRNFSILNGLACDKIFSKCEKKLEEFFDVELADNSHTKNFLTKYSKIIYLSLVESLENLRAKIVKTYADYYHKGKEETALRKIRAASPITILANTTIRVLLLIIVLLTCCYFLISYLGTNRIAHDKIFNTYFSSFEFSLMIILFLNGMAINMVILRHYRVNYVYLMDIDPCINLEVVNIFTNSLSLVIIWSTILILFRISIIYFYEIFRHYFYLFPMINLVFIFTYIFWPFKCFLHNIRLYFIKLVMKFFFPFGRSRVCFKLLIFATMMSTLSRAFLSFSVGLCVLSSPECREANERLHCDKTYAYSYVVLILPAFFRIFIAFNALYYTKLCYPHLVGALRFVTVCVAQTMSYLNAIGLVSIYVTIGVSCFSTIYNLYWDYFVSWKVFQKGSKNFLLRDNLAYPRWFYYVAIINNTIIRSIWTLRFIKGLDSQLSQFLQIFLEVFRRMIWQLIRVENEYFNNPEKFRKFKPVPEMTEDHLIMNKLN